MLLGSTVKKPKSELEDAMKFVYVKNIKYDLVVRNLGAISKLAYVVQIDQVIPSQSITHVFKNSESESIHILDEHILNSKLSLE